MATVFWCLVQTVDSKSSPLTRRHAKMPKLSSSVHQTSKFGHKRCLKVKNIKNIEHNTHNPKQYSAQ